MVITTKSTLSISNFVILDISCDQCKNIAQWIEQGAAALEPHYENGVRSDTKDTPQFIPPPNLSRALPTTPDQEFFVISKDSNLYENGLQSDTNDTPRVIPPLNIPRALPNIPSEPPKVPLNLPNSSTPAAPEPLARGASPTNLIILNTPPSPNAKKIPQLPSDALNCDLLTIPQRKTPISDPVSPNPPWHLELDRRHSDSARHAFNKTNTEHTYQNTDLKGGTGAIPKVVNPEPLVQKNKARQ